MAYSVRPWGNGRAPVPRFALVGDYRVFGDVGHVASETDLTPATPRCQSPRRCRASLAHAFDRRGRGQTSGEHRPHHRPALRRRQSSKAFLFEAYAAKDHRKWRLAVPLEGGLCVSASTKLKRPQTFSPCGLRVKIECL